MATLLERKIHPLTKLLNLTREMARPLRLVAADDLAERKTQPIDEIAITTQLGQMLELVDNRIWSSEWISAGRHGGECFNFRTS